MDEVIIYDVMNNYKFYILQKNGFINVSRICKDYRVDFHEWKQQYNALFKSSYQKLTDIFSLKNKEPILEYNGHTYVDICIAFHFIYWISFDLGVGFCANIIPFLCEYFK